MIRRDFLKAAGASAVGSLTLLQWADREVAHAAEGQLVYQGSDLSGWQVAVGDGLFAAEGEAPVTQTDIATQHFGDHSTLQANVSRRGIMAHNITYAEQAAPNAFNYVHLCEFSFRLPFVPSTANWEQNAQTFEVSFFIWDGTASRIDYGVALQWILNPWMASFGNLRTWINSTTPGTTENYWKGVGDFPVDTNWHRVRMVFDYQHQATAIAIDGMHFLSAFSATPKAATWSNDTVARFAAEIISIFPGSNHSAPQHSAEVRDWQWVWIPAAI